MENRTPPDPIPAHLPHTVWVTELLQGSAHGCFDPQVSPFVTYCGGPGKSLKKVLRPLTEQSLPTQCSVEGPACPMHTGLRAGKALVGRPHPGLRSACSAHGSGRPTPFPTTPHTANGGHLPFTGNVPCPAHLPSDWRGTSCCPHPLESP